MATVHTSKIHSDNKNESERIALSNRQMILYWKYTHQWFLLIYLKSFGDVNSSRIVRHQTITWTNDDLLLIVPLVANWN